MELLRLDPEAGGASKLTVEPQDGELFLGRNSTTLISDTLISRKHCSVYYSEAENCWKLKPVKPSYKRSSKLPIWSSVSDETNLSNDDQISLLPDKYIFSCVITNLNNSVAEPDRVESEKVKGSSPALKVRVLPRWMLELDDGESQNDKQKKDSKTPTKQVTLGNFYLTCES